MYGVKVWRVISTASITRLIIRIQTYRAYNRYIIFQKQLISGPYGKIYENKN